MTKSFYEAVLPTEGWYCAVGISESGRVIPSFHSTLDEVVARAGELVADTMNAYFALASFENPAEGRKTSNAHQLKSFFVDLDCGENKTYPDQIAAAAALREFVDKTKLPTPYVINSGWGLHAYWPFTESVSAIEWGPYARAFKQFCLDHELAIDKAVTADAARILRMPGTFNYKREKVETSIIAEGVITPLEDLIALLPLTTADISEAKMYGMDTMTEALAHGDYPPSSFARIVQRSVKGTGCAQIAHAVQDAATLDFNLWRAVLSIAYRCTDGTEAIHKVSSSYPQYDAGETQKLAEGTKGPYTCRWYKDNNSELCVDCKQKCASPIMLGVKMEESRAVGDKYIVEHVLAPETDLDVPHTKVELEIPLYPKPYFRGVNGGVFIRTKDPEGDPIELQVYQYDLYISRRFYDDNDNGEGDGELVEVNHHMPNDGVRRFVVPVTTLLTREKMRDVLLRHGVVAINKELDGIMAYFASSLRNLQKLGGADRARNQMGWTTDGSGFVVGELEYGADTVRLAPASAGNRHLAPMLTANGSLEKWTEMVNFYNRPGMEGHALGVFTGFGAPLLRLVGGIDVRGATINLISNKSGTGKTTAQMVANSIFGHPSELLLKMTDTSMSKVQWLGMMNSMLVTIDEVTNVGDDVLSEFIYEVPQGRGKHRMEAQFNRLRANFINWITMVLTSSNSSLYDKLIRSKNTPDGELRRLLEFHIDRPSNINKEESDKVFSALNYNYGLAGPVFIQYVLRNQHELQKLFAAVQHRIDKSLGLDQSDRFYSKILTAIFSGARIAKSLGLHDIDINRVFAYAINSVQSIKREVIAPVADSVMTVNEALSTFINENVAYTLIVNSQKRGEPIPVPINQHFRGPVKMRYEPDTKELWIAASALRDYFVERQVDIRQAMRTLTQNGVLKNEGVTITKRIGAGALGSFATGGVRCYCVDGEIMDIDNVFTQEEAEATSSGPKLIVAA